MFITLVIKLARQRTPGNESHLVGNCHACKLFFIKLTLFSSSLRSYGRRIQKSASQLLFEVRLNGRFQTTPCLCSLLTKDVFNKRIFYNCFKNIIIHVKINKFMYVNLGWTIIFSKPVCAW